MVERFVQFAGTISIATGASTVLGSGTAFSGDCEGAQVWAHPTAAAPYRIGTVAAIAPRYPDSQYDLLSLPLLHPWHGAAVVDQAYELLTGLALAIGTSQAAIYARFASFLEQNMGLVGNTDDDIDYSLVPNNTLFIDAATRIIYQWRAGLLEAVQVVGTAFTPRGAWSGATTYAANDLVERNGAAFISNAAGNLNHEPTTSPAPASSASWTLLPLPAGPQGADGGDVYDFILNDPARPNDGENLYDTIFARTVTFPAGLTGSRAKAGTVPTADAALLLRKNGSQFGTVTFPAGQATGVFAAAGATIFVAGDVLSIIAPSPRDATLAGLAMTISGSR